MSQKATSTTTTVSPSTGSVFRAPSAPRKIPNVVPRDLVQARAQNAVFIAAMKKASGAKKQLLLPSAATQNSEWAIKSGWSMQDAQTWRALVEKAKFATDDEEGKKLLSLVSATIVMAAHCHSHPVGLIHFARTEYAIKQWDAQAAAFLRENLLDDVADDVVEIVDDAEETEPDRDDESSSGTGKRRKYEHATQPDFDENENY